MSIDTRPPAHEAELQSVLAEYEANDLQTTDAPAQTGSPKNGVYYRDTVVKTDSHEVAKFSFVAGTSTTLHGHSEAAVLIKVHRGKLIEEYYIPVLCERKGEPGCVCGLNTACHYTYGIRTITAGTASYLPVGAYHRVHAVSAAPTVNVYVPPPSNAVAPVPKENMITFLTAKYEYLQIHSAMVVAKLFDHLGPKGIEYIVAEKAEVWAAREREQNLNNAICIHPDTIVDFRVTGILAAPIPIECGGYGNRLTIVVDSLRKLAALAPATALSLAMPLGNAAATTIPDCVVPEEHRSALRANTNWLVQKIVDEHQILAVANSEPGSAGDIKQTQTVAKRVPGSDVYELSGKKSFATIGPDADYFMCAAKRVEEGDVVDGFFIAKSNIKLDNAWDPLGMRPTASVGLTIEHAPSEAMLGYPGSLTGVSARHWSTLMFTAVFVGVAEGALRTLRSQLDERTRQSCYVRSTVAQLALDTDAAAGFLESLATDSAVPVSPAYKARCNNAKSFAARVAVETATQVSMLSGGRAYKANHAVSQILRDALAAPLLRPPFPKVMDSLAATWLDPSPDNVEL